MANHTLTALAPAKINLFLHVTGRRPDGYHLLQSLFCPVDVCDTITLTLAEGDSGLHLSRTGDLLHLPETKDLTARAARAYWQALQSQAPHRASGLNITLDVIKHIPEEAGMGGGSSNAAAVLRLLNQHFDGSVPAAELARIALSLGADVPFFLQDDCAFVEGIGETLTPLPGLYAPVLLYKPPVSCPTGQIFASNQLTRNAKDVKISVFDSVRRVEQATNCRPDHASASMLALAHVLKHSTENALEQVVRDAMPQWLAHYREFEAQVSTHQPLLTRMTGSGSAMFAVFASPSQLSKARQAVLSSQLLQTGRCMSCSLGSNKF